MRLRSPLIVFVVCVSGAAWGCGSGDETQSSTPSGGTKTTSTSTTTTKDAGTTGSGGGGTEACDTVGGEVYVSPTDDGSCDLKTIEAVPGCNHQECEVCTTALNCLPVCCVCDDQVTQYAATGCLNKTGEQQGGICMTRETVCSDENARKQGCANPKK